MVNEMRMEARCAPVQLVHGHEGIHVIGVLAQKGCYAVGVECCLTLLEQRLDPLHVPHKPTLVSAKWLQMVFSGRLTFNNNICERLDSIKLVEEMPR